jgi:hypothetical protein
MAREQLLWKQARGRGPRNRNARGIPKVDRLSATRGSQAEPTEARTEAARRDGPRRLFAHPFVQVTQLTRNLSDRE